MLSLPFFLFTQHLIKPRPRLVVPTFGQGGDEGAQTTLNKASPFKERCWVYLWMINYIKVVIIQHALINY